MARTLSVDNYIASSCIHKDVFEILMMKVWLVSWIIERLYDTVCELYTQKSYWCMSLNMNHLVMTIINSIVTFFSI